jgi:hypothetical protein
LEKFYKIQQYLLKNDEIITIITKGIV